MIAAGEDIEAYLDLRFRGNEVTYRAFKQAKQQVQVEKERVKQEEAKAEQEIVRAEADAEAIEIRGEALEDNQVVLRQEYINALKNGETIYVPADGGSIALTKEVDGGNTTATG
jgi:regulator of protease activity HflC (stomatin/prohibitin superfamily)